jgi:hypothetical protein
MMQMFAVLVVIRELVWETGDWLAALGVPAGCNAVYHWGDWHRSYAKYVVPRAVRLRARIGETSDQILAGLPRDLRSFLFHLDLSETSRFVADHAALVEELRRRGIEVYNSRIRDIRRRTVQSLLREAGLPDVIAGPQGDPDELMVVKSNYNYAGRSERLLSQRQRERLGLTDIARGIKNKWDYRLMRRRDVPAGAWEDAALAVERYVRGSGDRLHRFRICLDRWAISSCASAGAIKDFSRAYDFREELVIRGAAQSSLPDRAMRQALRAAEVLGMDFGAMDAIVDDRGDCHIVDINTTPGIAMKKGPRIEFMRGAWARDGEC